MKIRRLDGLQDYASTWQAMRTFTATRQHDSEDELWLLQHAPVFTLGHAGKPEHLLQTTATPIIRSDRGGQVTYHGPGQLVVYLLLDLKRRALAVRDLVALMEQSVIVLLNAYALEGYAKKSAPGVYVHYRAREYKIAALGLRVRHGCCYHGLALNVNMDLTPFTHINPCGYADLAVTQLADLLPTPPQWPHVEHVLLQQLHNRLS